MKTKVQISVLILCLFMSKCYASVFYIDPFNGSNTLGNGSITNPWKTLEYVINSNKIESHSYVTPYNSSSPQLITKNSGAPIKEGDIIMLYSGLHGDIFIQNYINSSQITIMAMPDNYPIFKKCRLQGAKNWKFESITVSSEIYGSYYTGDLFFLESNNFYGPVSYINIKNCKILSTSSPWTTASEWVNNASNGINAVGDHVVLDLNTLTNTRFGITLKGNYNTATRNIIQNFSGDGLRILGSNNLVEANIIKNCYKVDDNHDDGIQSFTTGGIIADNNIVRGNTILNYEDPNQPLLGPLQGIACFDGPFNNWIIENNQVIVNHWHGISVYGGKNFKIANNTVIDPTPTITPGPAWIKIEDYNGVPSNTCVVKNNISNTLSINPNSETTVGNNLLISNFSAYSSNFVNYQANNYHLLSGSSAIDNADDNFAPTLDFDLIARPQGISSDIGAFEYVKSIFLSTEDILKNDSFKVFPIPANDFLMIESSHNDANVKLFNFLGKIVYNKTVPKFPHIIRINEWPKGVYILKISTSKYNMTKKIIKE